MSTTDSETGELPSDALLLWARRRFHAALLDGPLTIDANGIASIADKDSKVSKSIAEKLVRKLGHEVDSSKLTGQAAGAKFEILVQNFIAETFPRLGILRRGTFQVLRGSSISKYDQYEHLEAVNAATKTNPALKVALGLDYLIKPDIVVIRDPETDEAINSVEFLVDDVTP